VELAIELSFQKCLLHNVVGGNPHSKSSNILSLAFTLLIRPVQIPGDPITDMELSRMCICLNVHPYDVGRVACQFNTG
jgi:hypothetical protein